MAKGKVVLFLDFCKGCELCTLVCPQGILVISQGFNKKGYHPVKVTSLEDCTGCAFCYDICPDAAIEVYQETGKKEEGDDREGIDEGK